MVKRVLFYVLSELYGLITSCRNALYDRKVFSSQHFDRPTTLIIGNLAV
ncbi:MAG: Tetraacyldisaccharide-P 4-kinase, partial [Bacteroidota bacterium]